MPPIQERPAVRLLRPLLAVPRERLRATLRARDQAWIEDPSNRDERYARIRVRRLLAATSDGEAHAAALARSASELGRFRAIHERKIADVLARAAQVFAEGYARLDTATLAAVEPGIGWRGLAALLAAIGGLDHLPRGQSVRDLHGDLCAGRLGRGRTLARCRLIPEGDACLIVRETRGIDSVRAGANTKRIAAWDGRFDLALAARGPVEIAGLGAPGWAEIVARAPGLRATDIPYAARLALPALRDRRGVLAVPSLGYGRVRSRKKAAIAAYRPERPPAAAIFAAALPA
jgi:tRNA(Ile)-lysidine synthase